MFPAGIFYGGYKDQDGTVCDGQGGGFAGVKAEGQPKGNLPSVGPSRRVFAPVLDYNIVTSYKKHQ